MKLVSAKRVEAAVHRLARYKLRRVMAEHGPLTEREAAAVNARACVPRAFVKLACRLWDREIAILDEDTGEIVRDRRKE